MLTLFVSGLCPDCPPAIEKLDEFGITYELVDITESMKNLKMFLSYRDRVDFFEKLKQQNQVGVPVLMIDDGKEFILLDQAADMKDKEFEKIKKHE